MALNGSLDKNELGLLDEQMMKRTSAMGKTKRKQFDYSLSRPNVCLMATNLAGQMKRQKDQGKWRK